MHFLKRIVAFAGEVFPAKVYASYAILWVVALEGSLALTAPEVTRWPVTARSALSVLSVWLVLFCLRALDEQKDLEYDRIHHPERPLPRGAISARELRLAVVLVSLFLLATHALVSPWAGLLLAINIWYAHALIVLEALSPRLRDSLFLNLLVTYPVQLMLSCYVYVMFVTTHGLPLHWSAVPLILMFACVFLHFEFARKTHWSRSNDARYYSNVVGAKGSAGLVLMTASAACGLGMLLFRPWQVHGGAAVAAWLPLLALAFPVAGGVRFLSRRVQSWPASLALAFLASYYLALIVQALVLKPASLS